MMNGFNQNNFNINKLLSHRCRGNGLIEHSLLAFKKACSSSIPFIEVDTRVTKDSKIILHHDSHAFNKVKIADTNWEDLKTIKNINGESFLTLDEALSIFKDRVNPKQLLCLDIKDFGYEENHLEQIQKRSIEKNICFISWIPQTLFRLDNLGVNCPLIFSHVNLLDKGLFGKILSIILKPLLLQIYGIVIIGENRIESSLGKYAHGYLHWSFIRELPDTLIKILVKNNGGVCLNTSSFGQNVIDHCKERLIDIWIFNTKTSEEYFEYYFTEGIDVIFSDDAFKVEKDIKTMAMGDTGL